MEPARIRCLALPPNPPSEGVARRRTNPSSSNLPLPSFSSSRASSADWLYPRFHKRQRCKGTGTRRGGLSPFASSRCPAIRPASRGAKAILLPCLKARTSCREASLYNVPAAIPAWRGGCARQGAQIISSPGASLPNGLPQLSHCGEPGIARLDQQGRQSPFCFAIASPHNGQRGG